MTNPALTRINFDALGSIVLTAIILVVVGLSSAQYGSIVGDVQPGAVAAAFEGFRG